MSNSIASRPSVFPWVTLEAIAESYPGAIKIGPFGSQLKKEELTRQGYKVYGQENVIVDDFSIGDRYVDASKFALLQTCQLFPGDIVLTMMGTIGHCAIFPEGAEVGIMDSHLLRIQVNQEIAYAKYVALVISSANVVGRQVTQMSHGSIMSGLSSKIVRRLQIPLAPLGEQRRIAEILDTADEAIRQTERLIAKLNLVKAGVLHDLLTRGLDEHGRLRDPQAHPAQFKDSPVGRIPRKWQVLTLDDITVDDAAICYGIVQPGPYTRSGMPVLAIYNLNGDYATNIHRSAKNIEEKYIRSRVRSGDVLLSVKGTTGRVGIVPSWFEGNISRDIARIRLKSLATPSFIRHMLEAPRTQRRLEVTTVGTTRAEISIWILKQFELPVPPLDEQVRIADALDAYDARIRTEEAALEKLRQVKRGLMDDLLTGRVRV